MKHSLYTTRYLVILIVLMMLVSIVNVADKELLATAYVAAQQAVSSGPDDRELTGRRHRQSTTECSTAGRCTP